MKDGKNTVKINNNFKEMAFFGKITASMTHEIKNVLAIIQESSGLLEDILDMTESNDFKHKDRFISTLGRIQAQIQRGIGITSNLNCFAHSPDNESSHIDLNELIQQLNTLTSRFARLKKVELSTQGNDTPLIVQANSVQLQMHIFTAIEIILQHIENGTLILRPGIQNKQITLCLNYDLMTEDQFNFISTSAAWDDLQKKLSHMGIHILLKKN
ncbi:MAG: histidine kinase A domain-containing protein [Candidatus Magnetoglobus multicellularis str. Araruama]|uniref:Histidine kinase A domain-containing protein n=1 Tax=Candidatus Magnetoglobus multicellularis str. Araruama TaxID=890399 RepID=A0A1V1PEU0_9BACT|nr:MAG: histidine kinase A domain-containing protein [Candidatus Magnetoglobus multicellularis str. Araruama]